jgi:hypothetical protein
MVPIEKRVVSALDVATTVSVAVVGTVDGATYLAAVLPVPSGVMVPQVGLQVVSDGYGIVVVGVPWVIRKVTP